MADTAIKDRRLNKQPYRHGAEHAQSIFVGVAIDKHDSVVEYAIVCHDGFGTIETEHNTLHCKPGENCKVMVEKHIITQLQEYSAGQGYKIELVACPESALPGLFRPRPPGLKEVIDKADVDGKYKLTFLPAVWLHLDANPFLMKPSGFPSSQSHGSMGLEAVATFAVTEAIHFLHPIIKASVEARVDPIRRAVQVDAGGLIHLNDLNQHAQITSPGLWKSFMALAQLHRKHKTKVSFLSATPSGGGVALMRHALLRLWRECGADITWRVPLGDPAVFQITKGKFHNVMQNKEKPGTQLTDDDKRLFESWTEQNVHSFWTEHSPFDVDVVVIDDPQLTACIPYVRKANPKAKIVFRSHIQIESHLVDKPGTLQHDVFSYLFSFIKQADLFVAHPVRAFVPQMVKEHMPVVYMPPSTDPLDGLNKPLSQRDLAVYKERFNQLAREQGNKSVDWDRGYIVQVARFDPSKGYDDLVEAYRLFRDKMAKDHPDQPCPQLVLTGNSSIDDPDGAAILEQIHAQISKDNYKGYHEDVITVKAPPLDQLLNTIVRCAWIACQVSTKEGFEVKVSEIIHKGIPIVVTDAGGIPLQVRDGIDGVIVKTSDSQAMADVFYKKATDSKDLPDIFRKSYDDAVQSASELKPIGGRWDEKGLGANEQYFTIANASMWGILWARLLYGEKDLQGLPDSIVEELHRLGVGRTSQGHPFEGLADEVVYSTISGRESPVG